MVHRLELLPSLREVDGSRVLVQLAGLHLNKGQILQVEPTMKGEEEGKEREHYS